MTTEPRRSVLVSLSVVVLVLFLGMLATGADLEADAPLRDIAAAHDQGRALVMSTSFLAMALAAAIVALGAGLRHALGRGWLADTAAAGFVVIGLTLASWAVIDYALWHAVRLDDDGAVRALHALSSTSFLPLMCGMACAYVGAGLAGLAEGRLPKWLAIAGVVLGLMAPLGPLGFAPAMLLPVWFVALAVTVRAG